MATAINDLKALARMEKACVAGALKNAEAIHNVAYNYLAHAVNTGDTRLYGRFLNAMPPRYAVALAQWGNDFGNLLISKPAKAPEYIIKISKSKAANLAGADTIGPMEYARKGKAKPATEFDFAKSLSALIEKAKKANVNGKAINSLTAALSYAA